eukprot:gene8968-10588_t
MLSIRRSEVPLYLQTSSFYLSLSEDDDEPIQIAAINFKLDAAIDCAEDLRNLLNTVRFWGLDSVLNELIVYCMDSENSETLLHILTEFETELDYLKLFPELLKLPQEKRVQHCAEFGNLAILRYVVEKEGGDFSAAVSIAAATGGSVPCLQYLVEENCPVNISAALAAAKHNQLDCLDYLFNIGIAMDYSTSSFYLSLSEEDDEPISIAPMNFKPDSTVSCALDLRLLLGTVRFWGLDSVPSELIDYCMNADNTIEVSPILSEFDSELDYLKIFPELQKLPHSKRIERCALFGNLPILQYILEKEGRGYSVAISVAAATGGSMPCLKYLVETHCPVDVTVAVAASRHNQLDCLAYLFSIGLATHYSVTQTAAANGHLRILQYIHQQGGPEWSSGLFTLRSGTR